MNMLVVELEICHLNTCCCYVLALLRFYETKIPIQISSVNSINSLSVFPLSEAHSGLIRHIYDSPWKHTRDFTGGRKRKKGRGERGKKGTTDKYSRWVYRKKTRTSDTVVRYPRHTMHLPVALSNPYLGEQ